MAGLECLCRRIAKALDAELYGTVNLDFADSGDVGTFAMMAEVEGATEERRSSRPDLIRATRVIRATESMT